MSIRESTNAFPRRNRLDLNTPAELAIRVAVDEVEKVGADVRLTEAVILLGQAREKVADYVDDRTTPAPTAPPAGWTVIANCEHCDRRHDDVLGACWGALRDVRPAPSTEEGER